MTDARPVLLKRKRFWVCILVPLYAATWVGGWISHARQLQERAERGYWMAEKDNEAKEAASLKAGIPFHPIKLRDNGPVTNVYWCVPVLPGVLLADSDYSVGPMYCGGGVKVVIYYVVGSVEMPTPWSWVA